VHEHRLPGGDLIRPFVRLAGIPCRGAPAAHDETVHGSLQNHLLYVRSRFLELDFRFVSLQLGAAKVGFLRGVEQRDLLHDLLVVRRRFLGGQLELFRVDIGNHFHRLQVELGPFPYRILRYLTCCSCASLATARLAFSV